MSGKWLQVGLAAVAMDSGQMMGPGWQGANGMYGTVFSFTTA